jgi:hypothetical protein
MSDAIELVIEPRPRDIGGFEVRRVLPVARRRMVGPFVFFDHLGPAAFAPGTGMDVRPHPHIGLATVTYLFEGEIVHRDSLGIEQPIRPGDVNWMVAGRGIVHSERTGDGPRAAGHDLHGIQTWIALPRADEETEPRFAHHPAADLPEIERDGAVMRLIVGSAFGERAPAVVFSPTFYLDVRAAAGARVAFPEEHPERAVYVVEGSADVDGTAVGAGNMAVLRDGADAAHAGRRRRDGRPAPPVVELRLQFARADRAGQGGLEGRPLRHGAGRGRVHPVAGIARSGSDASRGRPAGPASGS